MSNIIVSMMFFSGRVIRLVKSDVTITKSTNPVLLTKNIILTVIDSCCPPPVRLAAHCVSVGALIGT